MQIRSLVIRISALVCGLLSVCPTHADPIFVNNPSFETRPEGGLPIKCGTGCSLSPVTAGIPGWNVSGLAGELQPGPPATTTFFDSVPDGITVAYSNGGSISQTVADAVQLGFTYTLSVDQGVRNDGVPDSGMVALEIGGGATIPALGAPAAPGNWSTYTAIYIGAAADVGQSITIVLGSTGAGDWDNVRLDAVVPQVVPEPGSLALLGIAFATLGLTRRRNKA